MPFGALPPSFFANLSTKHFLVKRGFILIILLYFCAHARPFGRVWQGSPRYSPYQTGYALPLENSDFLFLVMNVQEKMNLAISSQVIRTFNRLIQNPENTAVDLEIPEPGDVRIVVTKVDGTKVRYAKVPQNCKLCQLLCEPLSSAT